MSVFTFNFLSPSNVETYFHLASAISISSSRQTFYNSLETVFQEQKWIILRNSSSNHYSRSIQKRWFTKHTDFLSHLRVSFHSIVLSLLSTATFFSTFATYREICDVIQRNARRFTIESGKTSEHVQVIHKNNQRERKSNYREWSLTTNKENWALGNITVSIRLNGWQKLQQW